MKHLLFYVSCMALLLTAVSCGEDSNVAPKGVEVRETYTIDQLESMFGLDIGMLLEQAEKSKDLNRAPASTPAFDMLNGNVVGTTTVIRHANSINVKMSTTSGDMAVDPAGHAVTMWGFTTPDNVNFGGGFVNGKVIGNNGKMSISGVITDVFDAATDLVIVIIRSHGEKLPAYMPEQIQTFCGACANDFCFAGPNTCLDLVIGFD